MALFNAAHLKEGNRPHPVEIKLGYIEEDGEQKLVTLTLNMSRKLLQIFTEADELFHASARIPVLSRKEVKRRKRLNIETEAKIINDFPAYCKMILEEGYLDSQNILDEPSLESLLMAIEQEPGFAEQLAHSLNYFFKGRDKYEFMSVEEEEKN